jgi:hypothetical protein
MPFPTPKQRMNYVRLSFTQVSKPVGVHHHESFHHVAQLYTGRLPYPSFGWLVFWCVCVSCHVYRTSSFFLVLPCVVQTAKPSILGFFEKCPGIEKVCFVRSFSYRTRNAPFSNDDSFGRTSISPKCSKE